MGHSEQGHSLSRLRTGSCVKPRLEKVTSWKSQQTTFPRSLEIPQTPRDSHFSNPATTGMCFTPSGLQDRSMSERNGLNRRCSSLCGNENHPSSTHFVDQRRADSIMARGSAPQTGRIHLRRPIQHPKILLAIGRRTIQMRTHPSSTHFVDQRRADSIMARGSLHKQAGYICADQSSTPKILLAIGRRTIHSPHHRRRLSSNTDN